MTKRVVAVRPFDLHDSNFKIPIYEEFVKAGGYGIESRPLEKYYRSLAFHVDLPTIRQNNKEARLRFVEGASLLFDTFPDYMTYEVIPMFWDCWPRFWKATETFFLKHKIRTAFFTSSQTASHFKDIFPEVNIFHIPEGIVSSNYCVGFPLKERKIDYLEYGRCSLVIDSSKLDTDINVLSSKTNYDKLIGIKRLSEALSDSKIVVALTRNDNQPEIAEGIDTLTQRYWECMLSGVVMLGRAPQELIDIIGYDPMVHLDINNYRYQIKDILANIEDYQPLVDRNRLSALKYADWSHRAKMLMTYLSNLGYIM